MGRTSSKLDVLFGRRPVIELLRAGRTAHKILVSERTRPAPALDEIRRAAASKGVPVETVPLRELDDIVAGGNHQGVVALTPRYRYTQLRELLNAPGNGILFLDGVMDPHNLGSLLRSADGAGFAGIVLPAHRSVGVTQTVRRVAAGAAEVISVARVANLAGGIEEARKAGLWIAGLDGVAEEDVWTSDLMEPPVGLVLGAEDRGMSRLVRERCDTLVRIPSTGRLGSLNVAVAGAIAMFEVARSRDRSATL